MTANASQQRTTHAPIYPFAAIVGMADLKLALLLNAVSPAIGGVLVRGEKGTAKSTVVRGLGALLPDLGAGCDLVELRGIELDGRRGRCRGRARHRPPPWPEEPLL